MADEILHYFLRNPRAADTLEGVARWRLLEEITHRRVEQTWRALGWLTDHGYLLATTTRSTGRIFRLNPRHRAEAERLVATDKGARTRRSRSRE